MTFSTFYEGKISVLMGVYNCEEYVKDAVRSIQNQTYTNWELIVCDDGSTDRTYQIVETFAKSDARIRLIKNEKNSGLAYSLNHCLRFAEGEFIARQDGDDISLPNRFEEEISCLMKDRTYQIVSSSMIFFDEQGDWGKNSVKEYPEAEDVVCGSPICHAPVMMYKSCMNKVCGYTVSPKTLRVEDVDLWIKLYAAGYRCHNLRDPLYKMRNDKNAFNRRKYKYRVNSTRVRLRGCRKFKLPLVCYFKSIRPMIYGLVPSRVRAMIRHSNRR